MWPFDGWRVRRGGAALDLGDDVGVLVVLVVEADVRVVLAGDEVDDAAGDGDGVVGESLVVTADEGQVEDRAARPRRVLVEQRREELTVEVVHRVVVLLERDRGGDVLAGDDRPALGDDRLGDLAHLQDVGAQLRRHRGLRRAQPGDLGDVPGEVAHPLEVGAHVHGRDDDAQVGRDGLLARKQVDRQLVELDADVVELAVGLDDRLGEVDVGVEQSGRGAGDGRSGEPGQLDELVRDRVEVLVELVAHGLPVSCRSCVVVPARAASSCRPCHEVCGPRSVARGPACHSATRAERHTNGVARPRWC